MVRVALPSTRSIRIMDSHVPVRPPLLVQKT